MAVKTKHFRVRLVPGDKRGAKPKNVAILADSLPLSTSRHNTMFLKNWQHLLYVYFSCVSGTNKSKQHHNKIKREGDFESANQITAKNHNIGERQAPYKRSNNNLANSCYKKLKIFDILL